MPKVSKKGQTMPESPIRKLAPYAEKAKKKGIHIYHLNIGQPDIETPKQFWDAIKKIDLKVLQYSPSEGFESLRKKYCDYFNDHCGADGLDSSDLIITTGASEGLFFTMLSILDEGDEIIIPEPLYANYVGYVKSGDIAIKTISSSIEDKFALPSISDFEKVITSRTKAILICNPNNPTGYVYSKEELERLKTIVLRHDLFLISDEVYREFIYGDEKHFSVLELEGLDQNAIIVDSFSKRFSACGARIGVIASKNKKFMQTLLKFAQQRLSPPTLEQIAGEKFFEVGKEYFDEVKEEYRKRRDVLSECLSEIEGVVFHKPNGAFYTMVKLPVENAEDFCKWMLESFEYEGQTVMMAPGSGFYATPGKGKDEVRIAYVLNCDELRKAMTCLKEGLKQYIGTNLPV